MSKPFVPLRIFSSFSMLEGAMEPKTIAERAALLGFPAAAITDRNGLYGVMPFSDACFAKGVQPIIGTTIGVQRPPAIGGEGGIDSLVLLAQDEMDYAKLCKLVSIAHLDRPLEQSPHILFELLQALRAGLVTLTAGAEGALARLIADGQLTKATAYLDALQPVYEGRLYIELARRNDLIEVAAVSDAVVTGNAIHFLQLRLIDLGRIKP